MKRRMLPILTALVLAVGLSACAPAPSPAPTPTGFASEEEAFAAAEETYRAYVDALNAVDLSDPETFEGVYAWTTGVLNADDRKNFSEWHAQSYSMSGTSAVVEIIDARDEASLVLYVCYDVSGVEVRDAAGASLITDERPDIQGLRVEFAKADTPTRLAIVAFSAVPVEFVC